MFAFALWDAVEQKLVLARDRLGKKPLFVAGTPRWLAELRLRARRAAARRPDRSRRRPVALAEYLQYGYVPSPRTILRDVAKLEPGTMMTWTPTRPAAKRRYWTLDYEPKLKISYATRSTSSSSAHGAPSRRGWSPTCRSACSSAAASTRATCWRRWSPPAPDTVETLRDRLPRQPLRRARHARAIAERFGSVHHEALVEPTDLVELLPQLVHHYGEPFADSSAVPTFLPREDGSGADHGGAHRRGRRRAFRRLLPPPGSAYGSAPDRLPGNVRRVAGKGRGAWAAKWPTRCHTSTSCIASFARSSSTPVSDTPSGRR